MSTDEERERLAREALDVEAQGRTWEGRSDAFLVGYVSGNRPGQFHTPALVEAQRRLLKAITDFNKATGEQTAEVIRLTWWLMVLTIVLGVIAFGQLAVALLQLVASS